MRSSMEYRVLPVSASILGLRGERSLIKLIRKKNRGNISLLFPSFSSVKNLKTKRLMVIYSLKCVSSIKLIASLLLQVINLFFLVLR